jgi:toxin ParE1/3/4
VREAGEAYEWHEAQRTGLGAQFLAALDEQFARIQDAPRSYAEILPGIRRSLLPHFPYGVFFATKGWITAILAIVHTSRNPRHWPRRR